MDKLLSIYNTSDKYKVALAILDEKILISEANMKNSGIRGLKNGLIGNDIDSLMASRVLFLVLILIYI